LKADSSANRKEPIANAFNADTVEVAAANKAGSHVAEPAYTNIGKPLNKKSPAPEKASVQNQETNYKVDTYYDGNLVRTEETDSNGNLQVTVKETMDGLGEVSTDDANYIEALEQLSNPKLRPEPPTNKANATYQAKNKHNNSVDYFNKVDVSEKRTPHPSDNMTLATQIAATIASEDASTTNNSTSNKEDNYFRTLGNESDERANEMRTIKIVRGDTLWSISQRAYGNGFDYKKIFNANPYLSDPDKIEVGDTLRVPI
jgi:nucleoid-associated protein YgaU